MLVIIGIFCNHLVTLFSLRFSGSRFSISVGVSFMVSLSIRASVRLVIEEILVRVIVKLQHITLRAVLFKELRDHLLALDQDFNKILGNALIALIVERGGDAFVANASSTACRW
jgi:hypothetical protein